MSWHFYWTLTIYCWISYSMKKLGILLSSPGWDICQPPPPPTLFPTIFSISGALLTGVFNVIQVRHGALQSIFVSTKGSMPLNGLWNILLIFVSSINERFLIFYSFFLVWTRLLLLWQYSPSRFQELWKVSSWCHNQEKSTSATQCKPIILDEFWLCSY